MQARVKFFTECVVNQALTRDAGEALERTRVHGKVVVGFSTGTRAGMAGV